MRTDGLTVEDDGANLRRCSPVPTTRYGFCGRCGSSLVWRATALPDSVSICAGTLEPPTHLRTTQARWIREGRDHHPRPHLDERMTE